MRNCPSEEEITAHIFKIGEVQFSTAKVSHITSCPQCRSLVERLEMLKPILRHTKIGEDGRIQIDEVEPSPELFDRIKRTANEALKAKTVSQKQIKALVEQLINKFLPVPEADFASPGLVGYAAESLAQRGRKKPANINKNSIGFRQDVVAILEVLFDSSIPLEKRKSWEKKVGIELCLKVDELIMSGETESIEQSSTRLKKRKKQK